MEKIEKNLALLGEDLNIKRIHAKIHDYLKVINNEAKKIYSGVKEQVNSPSSSSSSAALNNPTSHSHR